MSASHCKPTRQRLLGLLLLLLGLSASLGCGLSGYGAGRAALSSPQYHLVQRGDTVYSIARHYGVEPKTIQLLNGLRNPNAIDVGQRLMIAFRSSGGFSSSYDGAGPSNVSIPSGGQLAWPLSGGRIVSKFGPRRSSFHDGIDIAAPSGSAVYAAHNAKVVYRGSGLSGYGNLLILRDTEGIVTVYAHNRRLLARNGSWVKRGDKIAEVGSTGKSSGPHLHFEVRGKDRRGRYVAMDPLPLLGRGNGALPRFRVNESLTSIVANRRYSR